RAASWVLSCRSFAAKYPSLTFCLISSLSASGNWPLIRLTSLRRAGSERMSATSSYTVRSPSLTRTSALCWRPFTGITNSRLMAGPHRDPDGGVLVTTPATCGRADRHRQPATVGVRAVGVGAGENLFQLSLAQRGCVAGVPRLEPGQGRVVA